MGAYCLRGWIRVHAARASEIMQVLWSDYYGAVVFGEGGEVACLPHRGCRLEVVATAPTSHREVNLLLPGQVIRFKRWFLFGDRVELPSGSMVGLWHLVGFKFQLAPCPMRPIPGADALGEKNARELTTSVTV